MPYDSIPLRLRRQAKLRPDAPALLTKRGGRYEARSFASYEAEVRKVAKALVKMGVGKGNCTTILGFNREEWIIFDVATMTVGAAAAGIYTTSSSEEARYIVGHCEAPIILVENLAQLEKIQKVWDKLPALRFAALMQGVAKPAAADDRVLTWEELLAFGADVPDADVDARVESLEPDGLSTLIYTSGTTGPPKGVMLSHKNVAWTADTARVLTEVGPGDRVLSYLPLSHIAEQMFSIHGAITAGVAVYFAESIEKVPENLKEVEPTLFFGVPRIWEKFHAGITGKLAEAPPARRKIAELAMKAGERTSAHKMRGTEPSLLEGLAQAAADKVVFSKLKKALGLAHARICVSGAAPIAKDVLEFFAKLDVQVLEVYGQSEDTGPTSFNRPGRTKLGTVGPIIPGVEVKIADDGEILVRGPNVFQGYYKEPEATAEALKDGWLCSGDLGAIDAEGFLSITGRKKEIIITAGGKNITPKNIEEAIKTHPLVGEAVVIGDRRKFLSALVTLEPEAAARWAKERGAQVESLHENAALQAEVQRAIDKANEDLAQVEKIKKFHVLPKPFTIDQGELTPTLKVKRRVIYKNYEREIESMYE